MGKVRAHISMSLDGYVAGPNESLEKGLGEGGEQLHEWVFGLRAWREPHGLDGGDEGPSNAVLEVANANVGAEIMGRGKFGPPAAGRGARIPGKAGGATAPRSTSRCSS